MLGGIKKVLHFIFSAGCIIVIDCMNDNEFRKLLEIFDLSWTGYRKVRKGVKKRLLRHMQRLGCRTTGSYIAIIEEKAGVRSECELLLSVSISRFFRDRELWEALQEKILPLLIKENLGNVHVWSAGCASGEEVYSIKIIWDQLRKDFVQLPELAIIASDLNSAYLKRAKAGLYSRGSLKEVPEEVLSVYFEPEVPGKLYRIKDFFKKDIIWKQHHLLSDPPGHGFQVIFLRNNLLTYYLDSPKTRAFKRIRDSLSPGGFLIIGRREKLPFTTEDLVPYASYSYIFKKSTQDTRKNG